MIRFMRFHNTFDSAVRSSSSRASSTARSEERRPLSTSNFEVAVVYSVVSDMTASSEAARSPASSARARISWKWSSASS